MYFILTERGKQTKIHRTKSIFYIQQTHDKMTAENAIQ
jgi:hypothetical protein